MALINGKFEHEKNENLKEFILGVGLDEEFATKALAVKASMEVEKKGDEIKIVTVYTPTKSTTLCFTIGKEFDDPMPNGLVLKSIATIEGNNITIKCKKDGVEIGYRMYSFCDKCAVITMGSNLTPVIAKRHYRKV